MADTVFDYQQQIEDLGNLKQKIDQENDNYTIRKTRANLFFDDDAMVEYLASVRFPSDQLGALKYKNIDGELYYEDPNGTNKIDGKSYSIEFPNNEAVGFFGDKITPNLIPASTFLADVGGGMYGLKEGFKRGLDILKKRPSLTRNPWVTGGILFGSAAIGGFGGTFIAGGGTRGGRELLIDNFYNAPPEELAAAIRDLNISSSFSLIPFGVSTKPTATLLSKFSGKEDTLRYLSELRGSTDETIAEAKRLGFDMTPAEASVLGSRARTIQYTLSRQPEIQKIPAFYSNRAAQVRETIEVYADSMGSGKTVGDINTRVKEAGERALNELTRRRRARATKLYNYIKEHPEGIKVDGVDGVMDLIDSKLAGELLNDAGKVIRTVEPDPNTVEALTQLRKLLFDADGNLIDDLASLDARRTSSMQDLINKVSGTGDFSIITGIRDNLTSLMDEAEPIYALARRVYDPTKPALQLVEKSSIGKLGKLMTDKQTATAMKNLFDPNVSIKSLRNSRRVLQAVDANLFKDVKKEFILQQLDRVTKETLEQGLPRFQKYFAQGNIKRMMKEMLEPEEFDNFYRMNDLMGQAFSIHRGGSVTQPLLAEAERLGAEALGSGTKSLKTFLSLLRLPGRFATGQTGDELIANISRKQQDKYFQALTDVLVDPDATKSLDEVYNFVNANNWGLLQTATRGVVEGVEAVTEPSEQPYTGGQIDKRYEDLRNQIESIDPSAGASLDTVPVFEPETGLMPQELLSPTIIPDPRDREIAMRRQLGIAGLV